MLMMPAWGTGRQNVVMYAHKRTYSDDVLWPQNLGAVAIDPSTAPLSLFRLAGTNSGWHTKIRLAAAPNFSGGGIRQNTACIHKCRPKHPLSA